MTIEKSYNVVLGKNLKALYYRDTDRLHVRFLDSTNTDADELHSYPIFKQLELITDSYGEPDSLSIKSFKSDTWHKNKDLLNYVIISHFDESKAEAETFVDKILKSV